MKPTVRKQWDRWFVNYTVPSVDVVFAVQCSSWRNALDRANGVVKMNESHQDIYGKRFI